MNAPPKNLFIIVTDYPYGIGEPFLEVELFTLAKHFNKIYLIIPEISLIDKSLKRFKIPSNCEFIELNITNNLKYKLLSLFSLFGKSTIQEILNIVLKYKQKITLQHLKTIIGFKSMAMNFKNELTKYIIKNNIEYDNSTFYSYWFTYATLGLALLKIKNKNINVTTRIHGWDCFYYRNKLNYLPFRSFVLENINSICPISETGKIHLTEKVNAKLISKIHTHFLGVEKVPFYIKEKFDQTKIHIISVAFIDPVKRLDKIAAAINLIANFKVEWTHIGNEPNNHHSFQKKIEMQFQNNVNIKINFLGELSKIQIYNYLESIKPDVLLCTSSSEGIPVSMMEALAHSIPIISLNVGGVAEIVKENINGFLLNSDATENEIAQKIIYFQELSIDKRKNLCREAYQFYLNHFSAEKNYFRFLKQELLHE